jgi:hypothetical protein
MSEAGKIKGQMSFTIKPFAMLMLVVLLLFLFMFLNSNEVKKENVKKSLDMMAVSTDILLLLANSEECLAYRATQSSSAYANIVDVSKLEEFSGKYRGIEPLCSRNYGYGYRVEITEIEMANRGPREGLTWAFGVEEMSGGHYDSKMVYSMPVALKRSESHVGVGVMKITLISGDLERAAGAIDRACMLGKMGRETTTNARIHLSYPLRIIDGKLCYGLKDKDCRTTLCELEMKDISSKGTYRLIMDFSPPNKLIIET